MCGESRTHGVEQGKNWRHKVKGLPIAIINVVYYDDFEEFVSINQNPKIYMVETKAKNLYTNMKYEKNSFFMFGKESTGIPEEILVKYKDTAVRIDRKSVV